jgi:AraC-like DNA-binding protein
MVMFLCSTRHSFSHLLDRAPADASVAQIRRAEEYIEANWRQPITLEALAAETEMSAFELFRAFKNSRGYSPMEFADRVRLRHARELLHHADDVTAIAAVAAACSFGDFDRFTVIMLKRSESVHRRHCVRAGPAVLQTPVDHTPPAATARLVCGRKKAMSRPLLAARGPGRILPRSRCSTSRRRYIAGVVDRISTTAA